MPLVNRVSIFLLTDLGDLFLVRAYQEKSFAIVLKNLGMMIASYLSTWLLISLYYWVRLGHFPDYIAFVEYAIKYKGGHFAHPLDSTGSVWLMLFVFCLSIATFLKSLGGEKNQLPLTVCALVLLWTTSSYFVMRSHPNNVLNLMPFIISTLLLLIRSQKQTFDRILLKTALIPIFCILGTAAGSSEYLGNYFESLFASRDSAHITHENFFREIEIQDLLSQGHVQATDPMLVLQNFLYLPPSLLSPGEIWGPIAPASAFALISPERQILYIDRFLQRKNTSGWLLYPTAFKGLTQPDVVLNQVPLPTPHLISTLYSRTHVLTQQYENANWRLERYELKHSP